MMDQYFVTVGEKQYQVIKTGRAQASQVIALTKWINRHGVPSIKAIQEKGVLDNAGGNVDFLLGILDVLTEDAVVDLFTVAVGCSPEESEIYFDVATLIDAVAAIYQGQPAIQRLVDRFFSQSVSEVESQPESYTISEEVTDGQTT